MSLLFIDISIVIYCHSITIYSPFHYYLLPSHHYVIPYSSLSLDMSYLFILIFITIHCDFITIVCHFHDRLLSYHDYLLSHFHYVHCHSLAISSHFLNIYGHVSFHDFAAFYQVSGAISLSSYTFEGFWRFPLYFYWFSGTTAEMPKSVFLYFSVARTSLALKSTRKSFESIRNIQHGLAASWWAKGFWQRPICSSIRSIRWQCQNVN